MFDMPEQTQEEKDFQLRINSLHLALEHHKDGTRFDVRRSLADRERVPTRDEQIVATARVFAAYLTNG